MWHLLASTIALSVTGLALTILGVLYYRSRQQQRQLAARFGAEKSALEKRASEIMAGVNTQHQQGAWYERVFRSAKDVVLAYGVDENGTAGKFLDCSDEACLRLEYSRDEICNLSPGDVEVFRETAGTERSEYSATGDLTLTNKEVLARDSSLANREFQILVKRVLREGKVDYEGAYITRSGKRLPMEIRAQRSEFGMRSVIVCTATDITEERRMKEALRESEQRYKDFFTTSPIGVVLYDGQRQIVDVNASCLRMFGCPERSEFCRFNLFDNVFLTDAARDALRRGQTTRFELAVDFDRFVTENLYVPTRKGTGYFDFLVNDLGVDKNYSARGFLVQVQDITQRKETEAVLREREKQLRQAQKLEALGALSGGIAHDFNNILTPILGYADLGLGLCKEGEQTHWFFDEIRSASRRAKALVSQILAFSRKTEDPTVPMRLAPIVKEVLKQLEATVPTGIKLIRSIKTEQDLVLATPTQIHQILMNLCTNAIHVMKQTGGELEVRLSTFVLSTLHRKEFPKLATREYLREGKRSRYVRLSVRDSGRGMDAVTLERIFEPFFTTKPSGEGTGMGLAVVHGIVSSLNGAISVESEVDKGTVFHVVFPAVEEVEEKRDEVLVEEPESGQTVLFVDDEVGILKMAEIMLRMLGYKPVVTNESVKALEMFRKSPTLFDLVITDQVMPAMTGFEMAKKMLAIRPDIPIVLCTGFGQSLEPGDARAAGIREVIMKPIERRDLAEAIHRALLASNAEAEDVTVAPPLPDDDGGPVRLSV